MASMSPRVPLAPEDPDGLNEEQEDDEVDEALDELLEEFYAFTYDEAVLVGGDKASPNKKSPSHSPLKPKGPLSSAIPPTSSSSALSRELLNALLPPKAWQEPEAGTYQRMVSMAPSSRHQVQRFQEAFHDLLLQQQARATAICPVRERLFLHVFDELIRQVTCECPERGLLLVRLRDELRLTIEAYQTLYHNSIAYGRQKAVQAEAGMMELEAEIQRLMSHQTTLLNTKHRLTHRVLVLEEQLMEDQTKRASHHEQTLQFLKAQRLQLETFYRELSQETPNTKL